MERPRRKLFAALGIVVLVAGLVMIREVFFGYTTYLFIVPTAKLFVDGKPEQGWLHRGNNGKILIVTRTASGKRESYWVQYRGEKGASVRSCDGWRAGGFPLIAIGDANPPCFSMVADPGTEARPNERPQRRLPLFGARFVEFIADNGDRLKVIW